MWRGKLSWAPGEGLGNTVGASRLIKTRPGLDKNMLTFTDTGSCAHIYSTHHATCTQICKQADAFICTSTHIFVRCVPRCNQTEVMHTFTTHQDAINSVKHNPAKHNLVFSPLLAHHSLVLRRDCHNRQERLCATLPFGLCSYPHLSLTYVCVFLAFTL